MGLEDQENVGTNPDPQSPEDGHDHQERVEYLQEKTGIIDENEKS